MTTFRLVTTVNPGCLPRCLSGITSWLSCPQVVGVTLLQAPEEKHIIDNYIKDAYPDLGKRITTEPYCNFSTSINCSVVSSLLRLDVLLTFIGTYQDNSIDTVLFLNSDILLSSDRFFSQVNSILHSGSEVAFIHRLDIDCESCKQLGFYLHGIDGFIIKHYRPDPLLLKVASRYYVGMPGWDHILPLIYSPYVYSQSFLCSSSAQHCIHPTSNPGHYRSYASKLISDYICFGTGLSKCQVAIDWLLLRLCAIPFLLSLLHKLIVYPRLRSLGWSIRRKAHLQISSM